MSAEDDILVERRHDGISILTLNRPHRANAMTESSWDMLAELLSAAEQEPETRAIVIRSAGKHFCSGSDLDSPLRLVEGPEDRMRRATRVAMALHELTLPTIACVRGGAVGAGANLALGCDYVITASNAYFWQSFIHIGFTPDLGGTWLLPRLVGTAQAKRLALLGEKLPAEEAHALGLILSVVDEAELDGAGIDLAVRAAALDRGAYARTKRMLTLSPSRSLAESLDDEAASQVMSQTRSRSIPGSSED